VGAEDVSGSCPEVRTRTYRATDACGNSSTCSRSVTVRDITAPTITCAPSVTIDCPTVPSWPDPTGDDECSGVTIDQVGAEDVSGSCPEVRTRTYRATDACGNSSTCSRSVTVRDITAPTITCAPSVTIDCPTVPSWPDPTGDDECSGVTIDQIGSEDVSGTCPEVRTRTYRATDACGNSSTCSRSVTIRDITAPTITCAPSVTIDCPTAPSWPLPTGDDECSTATITQIGAEDVSGTCPEVRTRTYRATDACGNSSTCSRSVTIRDITAPTITCAPSVTIDCPTAPSWPDPTGDDECSTATITQLGPETSSGTCPEVHTRTYRATDACGNSSTCSRSVTVRDITAPTITCAP